MASKIFGGANLSDIARSVKERAEPSPFDKPTAARPVLATAEMAITGRLVPALERENIFAVDPRRCRPWKYHNRTAAWYTRERCIDLIESIAKDGQQEPVVARKLVGDPNFDYELVYGMRRRFACEYLNAKVKLRLIEADDTRAAVLMHIENADRQDITAMERALLAVVSRETTSRLILFVVRYWAVWQNFIGWNFTCGEPQLLYSSSRVDNLQAWQSPRRSSRTTNVGLQLQCINIHGSVPLSGPKRSAQ